jgi:hypothetical protein
MESYELGSRLSSSAISWHSPIRTWLGEADRTGNFAEFACGDTVDFWY